jgi:hypothetical protein
VGLDQAGHHQAARRIDFRRVGVKCGRNGANCRVVNTDIDDAKLVFLQDAGVTDDEFHQFTAEKDLIRTRDDAAV